MFLPRDRLYVLANDVEVSALPIADFGSNYEHVTGIAKAKARLVPETDGEVQRPVVDGVSNEIHDLAVDFGILPAQPFLRCLLRFSISLRSSAVVCVMSVLPHRA
jgi:hypothetical protein